MIASGGFADGRGLVAALALGADGMNMGTRFMCTKESPIHENIKKQIVENDERATDLVNRVLRNTSRVARNSISQEVLGIQSQPETTIADVAHLVSGQRGKVVYETGDKEHGMWTAGMVQGSIHDIPTAKELIDTIIADAERIIQERLHGSLKPA